ncbi:MAG: DUF5011 domain-containing protein [Erysipelotrichaceae bacterium]|nr:DUF5011 domain-containing protein [Erysipelotrichaceae bacterium]
MRKRWGKNIFLSLSILFGAFILLNINASKINAANQEMISTIEEGEWSNKNASLVFTMNSEWEEEFNNVYINYLQGYLNTEEIIKCEASTTCKTVSFVKSANNQYTLKMTNVTSNKRVYYYVYVDTDESKTNGFYGYFDISRIDTSAPTLISPTPNTKGVVKGTSFNSFAISHSYYKEGDTHIDLEAPIKSITFTGSDGTPREYDVNLLEYSYSAGTSKFVSLHLDEPISELGTLSIVDMANNKSDYILVTDQQGPQYSMKMADINNLNIFVVDLEKSKFDPNKSSITLYYVQKIYGDGNSYSEHVEINYFFSDLSYKEGLDENENKRLIYTLPVYKDTEYEMDLFLVDEYENISVYEGVVFDTYGPTKSSDSPEDGGYYSNLAGKELAPADASINYTIYYSEYYTSTSTWGNYNTFSGNIDSLSPNYKYKWYIQNDDTGHVSPEYFFVYDTTAASVVGKEINYSSTGKCTTDSNGNPVCSGKLTITFPDVVDSQSGMKSQRYTVYLNDALYLEGFIDETLTISSTVSGSLVITATYINNVGLTSVLSLNVNIDNTKPEVVQSKVLVNVTEGATFSFNKEVTSLTYITKTIDGSNITTSGSSTISDFKSTSLNIKNILTLQSDIWYVVTFSDVLGNESETVSFYCYNNQDSFFSEFNMSEGISCNSSNKCTVIDETYNYVSIVWNTKFNYGLNEIGITNFDLYYLWTEDQSNLPSSNFLNVYYSAPSVTIGLFDGITPQSNIYYYWNLSIIIGEERYDCTYENRFSKTSSTLQSLDFSDRLFRGGYYLSNTVISKSNIDNLPSGATTYLKFVYQNTALSQSEFTSSDLNSVTFTSDYDAPYLHVLVKYEGDTFYYISPYKYYVAALSSFSIQGLDVNGKGVSAKHISVNSSNVVVSDTRFYVDLVYQKSSVIEDYSGEVCVFIQGSAVTCQSFYILSEQSGVGIISLPAFSLKSKVYTVGTELEIYVRDSSENTISFLSGATYTSTIQVTNGMNNSSSILFKNDSSSSASDYDETIWHSEGFDIYAGFSSSLSILSVQYVIVDTSLLKIATGNSSSTINNFDEAVAINYLVNNGYMINASYGMRESYMYWSQISINLADGKYLLFVKVTTSSYIDYIAYKKVLIDNKAPTININSITGVKENNHVEKNAQEKYVVTINYSVSESTNGSGMSDSLTCKISDILYDCVVTSTTVTITYLGTKSSELNVELIANDNAGNSNSVSKSFYLDLNAPTVSSVESKVDTDSANLISVSFSVNDDMSDFDVYYRKGKSETTSDFNNILSCSTNCNFKIANSEHDTYSIYVVDADGNGGFYHINLNTPSKVVATIVEDGTNIIKGINNYYYTKGILKVKFENTSEYEGLTYYFSQNLVNWDKLTNLVGADTYRFEFNPTLSSDGAKTWYIKVVTQAGLEAIIYLYNVYVDTSGPNSSISYEGKKTNDEAYQLVDEEEKKFRCDSNINTCYFNYLLLRYNLALSDVKDEGVGTNINHDSSRIILSQGKSTVSTIYTKDVEELITQPIKLDADLVTAENQYTLTLILYDLLGNYSENKITIIVDRQADEVDSFVYLREWTKGPLEVLISLKTYSIQSPISSVKYWLCGANTSCDKSTATDVYDAEKIEGRFITLKSISSNGYWNIELTDKAGNITKANLEITNVDNKAPVLCQLGSCDESGDNDYISYQVSAEGWSKENILITFVEKIITFESPNMVLWQREGDAGWRIASDWKALFAEEGVFTINLKAADIAGNESNKIQITIKIDKTAPELGEIIDYERDKWVNEDVELTVGYAKDVYPEGVINVSEVAASFYSVDGKQTWNLYTKDNLPKLSYTCEEGKVCVAEIYLKSIDEAGNVTESEEPIYVKIDKEAPEVGNFEVLKEDGTQFDSDEWVKEKLSIRFYVGTDGDCDDKLKCSGVYQNQFTLDGEKWETYVLEEGASYYELVINTTVNYKISVKIIDIAGNETVSEKIITVKVDMDGPKVDVTYQVEEDDTFVDLVEEFNTEKWYNKRIQITLNIEDNESGLNKSKMTIYYDGMSSCVWSLEDTTGCPDYATLVEKTENKIVIKFIFEKDGSYSLTYSNEDKLANLSEGSKPLLIDRNENADGFTTGLVTVNPEISSDWINDLTAISGASYKVNTNGIADNYSGVEKIEYTVDGIEFKEISLNTSKNGGLKTEDGEYSIYIKITDKAGNISYSNKITYKIDTTKPTIKEESLYQTGAYCQNCKIGNVDSKAVYVKVGDDFKVTVPVNVVNIEDNLSGVDKIQYRLADDDNWFDLSESNKIELSEAGAYSIAIRAIDKAGNISNISNSKQEFSIITSTPKVPDIKVNGTKVSSNNEFMWLSKSDNYRVEIVLTIIGMSAKYQYQEVKEGSTYQESAWVEKNGNSFNLAVENKKITLYVRGVGYYGTGADDYVNGEIGIFNLGIDLGITEDDITFDYDDSTTNQEVIISGTIANSFSHIKSVKAVLTGDILDFENADELLNGEDRFEYAVSNSGTYTFKVEDNAGNVIYKELEISNIDKDNPLVQINISQEELYLQRHSVSVSIEDQCTLDFTCKIKYYISTGNEYDEAEFGDVFYSEFEDNLVYENTGIYYLHIYVIDAAGNDNYVISGEIKIDKTNPTIGNVEGIVNNKWYNQDVTITFTEGTDAESQFSHYEYSIDGEDWIKYTGNLVIETSKQYQFSYKGCDFAGNCSNGPSITFGIDKEDITVDVQTTIDTTIIVKGTTIKYQVVIGPSLSGIKEIKYLKVLEESNLTYEDFENANHISLETKEFELNKSGKYVIMVSNIAGSYVTKYFDVNCFDNKAPTINFAGIYPEWKNTYDNITVTIEDEVDQDNVSSGLANDEVYYFISEEYKAVETLDQTDFATAKKGSSNFTITDITETGIYYIYVLAKDEVGNVQISVSDSIKLDKTTSDNLLTPIIQFKVNGEIVSIDDQTWVKGPISVYLFNPELEYSPVSLGKVRAYKVETTSEYFDYIVDDNSIGYLVGEINSTGKHIIEAYLINEAGTESRVVRREIWIDVSKPMLGDYLVNEESYNSDLFWYDNFTFQLNAGTDGAEESGYSHSYYVWYIYDYQNQEYKIHQEGIYNSDIEIVENGLHKLEVYAVDNVGNKSDTATIEFGMDAEIDAIKFEYDKNPTNRDLQIQIVYENVISQIKALSYIISNESITLENYNMSSSVDILSTKKVTLTDNYVLNVYIEDESGNKMVWSEAVTNIDKIPPSYTISVDDDVYKKEHVVTINYGDDCNDIKFVKYYIDKNATNPNAKNFENLEEKSKLNNVNFSQETGNWYTHILVQDFAGNATIRTSSVLNFDTTAPTNGVANIKDGSWYQSVEITITDGNDSHSEFDHNKYLLEKQISGIYMPIGEWSIYTEKIVVDTEGTYRLTYYSVDKAGNEAIEKKIVNFGIDTTAPTIKEFIVSEDFVKGNSVVKVYVEDLQSGILEVKYKVNKDNVKFENASVATLKDTFYEISINANGSYAIEVSDVAGNKANGTFNVTNIDINKPSITIDVNSEEWQLVTNVSVSISSNDPSGNNSAISKVKTVKYCWSTENITMDENSFYEKCTDYKTISNETNEIGFEINLTDIPEISGSYYVYAMATDGAGNTNVGKSSIIRIDNTTPENPSIVALYLNNEIKNNTAVAGKVYVNIYANENDGTSGINHYECSINGTAVTTGCSSFSIENEGTYVIAAKTVDNVGLSSEIVEFTFKIDTTKPTIGPLNATTISGTIYQENTWVNENVNVILPTGDDNDTIALSQYRLNKGEWTTYNVSNILISNSGINVLEVKVKDSAGNESEISQYQIKIDKDAPSVGRITLIPSNRWLTEAPKISTTIGIDELSGFKGYQYLISKDGSLFQDYTDLAENTVLPSELGTYTITIRAIDNSGNVSTSTKTVQYVIVEESLILELEIAPETFTNESVDVNVILNNSTIAYLEGKEYKLEYVKVSSMTDLSLDGYDKLYGDVATEFENLSFSVSENGNYVVVLKILNNGDYKPTMIQGITISNIDKEKPSININVPSFDWLFKSDDLTVIFRENGFSGLAQLKYYWSTSSAEEDIGLTDIDFNEDEIFYKVAKVAAPTISGIHYLHVYAIDVAGNSFHAVSIPVNIDREAPANGTVSITPSGKEWHNSYYELMVSSTEDYGSGFSHYNYRILKYINDEWKNVSFNVTSAEYLETGDYWMTLDSSLRIYAIEGRYKVQFVAVDKIGNVQPVPLETEEIKIDVKKPTVSVKCNDNECLSSWYTGAVNLTFEGQDALSGIDYFQYSIVNGQWINANNALIEAEGQTSVQVRSVDKSGNYSDVVTVVIKIDSQEDNISIDVGGVLWTNQATNVHIGISGNRSPMKRLDVTFNENKVLVTENKFVVENNGNIHVEYEDEAGNITTLDYEVSIFDKLKPIISIDKLNGPYSQSHNIALNAQDKDSSIQMITYTWNNGTKDVTENIISCNGVKDCNVTIPSPRESGTWSLKINIIDRAGNETQEIFQDYLIDVDKPTSPSAIWSEEKMITDSYEGSFTFVAGEDEHSGVEFNQYQLWKADNLVVDWTNCENGIIIDLPNEDGLYKLVIKTIDSVGLESSNQYFVTLDTIADEIILTKDVSNWTKKDVTITISVNSTSDIVIYGVLPGEKTITDFAGEFTVISNKWKCALNGTYTIYAKDEAGNESVKTITIDNIDKEEATIDNVVDDEVRTSFEFDVIIKDTGGSKIKSITYNWIKAGKETNPVTIGDVNDEEYTLHVAAPSESGSWTLKITVIDYALNEKVESFIGYKVDLTGPVVSNIYDSQSRDITNNSWHNENVTITSILCEDMFLTEGNVVYYRLNENDQWTLYEEEPILFEQEGEFVIYFQAIDALENVSEIYAFKFFIDKTTPVLEAEDFVIDFEGTYEHVYQVTDNMDADIAKKVKITDNVNVNKAGEYNITYEATDNAGNVGFKTIKVIVRSEVVPIIELDTSEVIVEVNTGYELPFAIIRDAGNEYKISGISTPSFDTTKLGTYTVVYSYTNIAGQNVKATKVIIVKDTTAPMFNFNKLNKELIVGSDFSFEAVEVTDNYDENVSYTVSGDVNTSKKGSYELTFVAKDSSNNERIEKVVIKVVEEKKEFDAVLFVEVTVITMLTGVLGSFGIRKIRRKKKLAD